MKSEDKGCPYWDNSAEGLARQAHLEVRIEEWKRKNRNAYETLKTYLREEKRYYIEYYGLITQTNSDFVRTFSIPKGTTGTVITVTIPYKYEAGSYMGNTTEIPRNDAYGFSIKIADASGKEILDSTKLEVQMFDPVTQFFDNALDGRQEVEYSEVRRNFKFNKHGYFQKGRQQRWRLIKPDMDVVAEKVEYKGTWDLWRMK